MQKHAAVIYFTENGKRLATRVQEQLEASGQGIAVQMGKKPGQPLKEWCREAFEEAQLLVFIGAAGIAVRSIAPFVNDKFTDPAVLVLDEKGKYVVPILSGHVGGGNRWAAILAEGLSAEAVVTTATDLNGKFAVDVFASRQNLALTDRRLAKEVSSAVLKGEPVGFCCEGGVSGSIPQGLVWQGREACSGKAGCSPQTGKGAPEGLKYQIYTGIHTYGQAGHTLCLHPKSVAIGIGCKEGKGAKEIEALVLGALKEHKVALESVFCLASIELKKEEPGILEFAQKYQLPFYVFSAAQLARVPGAFHDSEFVKRVTGVGNVCERAAVLAAMGQGGAQGNGSQQNGAGLMAGEAVEPGGMQQNGAKLIVEKTAGHGVTLALAEQEWSVVFE